MIVNSPRPTRVVTDFTFRFIGGDSFTITLAATDIYEFDGVTHIIQAMSDDTRTVERTFISQDKLLSYTKRLREVDTYEVGQSPLELEIKAEHARTTAKPRTLPREGASE